MKINRKCKILCKARAIIGCVCVQTNSTGTLGKIDIKWSHIVLDLTGCFLPVGTVCAHYSNVPAAGLIHVSRTQQGKCIDGAQKKADPFII